MTGLRERVLNSSANCEKYACMANEYTWCFLTLSLAPEILVIKIKMIEKARSCSENFIHLMRRSDRPPELENRNQ